MYYKNIYNNFIETISTGCGQTEITEQEYNAILNIIRSAPTAPDSFVYKLRADTLEWELVELPPVPEPSEDPAAIEDYENALVEMGVDLNGD